MPFLSHLTMQCADRLTIRHTAIRTGQSGHGIAVFFVNMVK